MGQNSTELSDSDEQLLADFDEILIESYPSHIVEVLGRARDRLDELITKDTIDESLLSGLSEIISYPGNLSDGDVKTLKAILSHLRPSTEI